MPGTPALTESTYYILLSLHKPRHGYGIMQQTEELSVCLNADVNTSAYPVNKRTCNGLSSSSYCLMLSNWPFKSDYHWPSIPDANNPAAGRGRLRTVSETAIMQYLGV